MLLLKESSVMISRNCCKVGKMIRLNSKVVYKLKGCIGQLTPGLLNLEVICPVRQVII
jgi:hypothetical protein